MAFLGKNNTQPKTTKDEEEQASIRAQFLLKKQIENMDVKMATLEREIEDMEKSLKPIMQQRLQAKAGNPKAKSNDLECTGILRKLKAKKTSLSKAYKMQQVLENQLINLESADVDEDFYSALKVANQVQSDKLKKHDENLDVLHDMKQLEADYKRNQEELDGLLTMDDDDEEEIAAMMAHYEEEITAEMTQNFELTDRAIRQQTPYQTQTKALGTSTGEQIMNALSK